jgi:tetratricopeptide (TPR) repeat protein
MRAIEQDRDKPDPQVDLALVHLAEGDIDGYRKASARLLNDFGQSKDVNVANAVAWTCTLAPEAVNDREAVVRCAQAVGKTATKDSDKHSFLQTLGAATYRANRFNQAIDYLNEAMKALPEPGVQQDVDTDGDDPPVPSPRGDALDWLFLAMAHHRLGHGEEARTWLEQAVASIDRADQDPPHGASTDSRIDWQTHLSYRVLRREAEGLIAGSRAAEPKATGDGRIGR